jgi:hypothetical protein
MRTGHRLSLAFTAACAALAFGLAGCGKSDDDAAGHHDAHHGHQPKNGGELIEVGGHEFNLELKREGDSGKLTAWVLDAHAENYVRIPAPSFELALTTPAGTPPLVFHAVANAASGETVGDTAQFEARAEWLKTTAKFSGQVKTLTLRGKTFTNLPVEFPAAHAGHAH